MEFLITAALIIGLGVAFALFALLMGHIFGRDIKRLKPQTLVIDSPAYRAPQKEVT